MRNCTGGIALAAAKEELEIDEWVVEAIEMRLTGKRYPPPTNAEKVTPRA